MAPVISPRGLRSSQGPRASPLQALGACCVLEQGCGELVRGAVFPRTVCSLTITWKRSFLRAESQSRGVLCIRQCFMVQFP